ncbi:MAG: lysophospholipid acyltransferase family protein [Chitinophagales bacterium]
MLYWVAWGILRLVNRLFFRWQVSGSENFPATGGAILASNHVSALDPFIAGTAIRRKVHFMAKEEIFASSPLVAFLARNVGAFPVRRGEADRQAIRTALHLLGSGEVVGIFPEGTRSQDGQLQQAQTGIAFLARKGKIPVVPVAVCGTEAILPKGAKLPRPARVKVFIGRPLYAEDETAPSTGEPGAQHDSLRRFSDRVMEEIARLQAEAARVGRRGA